MAMEVARRQRPPPGAQYLDHLAHFVPSLDAAAAVWESVGFLVTPVSHHNVSGRPAGTSNRCVMFEDGYMELLEPTLDTPHAARVRERMKRFVGVHLCCFGTPDSAAERRRLADHGFEPEPLVNLERTIDSGALLRFNVIYVPPQKMPEGRVQYCEHLTPEHVWREGYVNRVSMTAVYVVADDPAQAAARWGRFAGMLPRRDGDLVELLCARGRIRIGDRSAISRILGSAPPPPSLAGYALAFDDPAAFAARCRKAGLQVTDNVVSLPPALGGAWLLEARRRA
jgi:hypothetical protein